MADMRADLAFLESLLVFTRIPNLSVEERYKSIMSVFAKQLFFQSNPDSSCIGMIRSNINQSLVETVAYGFITCRDKFGIATAINILDKKLQEVICNTTGVSPAALNKRVIHSYAISDLMTRGIHINEEDE
jgi:hypothetical protein